MTNSIKNVGFIGLGNIGKPMAKNLLKGDFQLWVYDVFADAAKGLVKSGAHLADSVQQLATVCDYIGVCVRDDNDVAQVMQAILSVEAKCRVVAIHSTVKPETIVEQAQKAKAQQIELIDAPITGGASGAANGTLCYMVGGSAQALDFCHAILQLSAKEIIHCGDLGKGMIAKLCNNLITYAQFTAIYESMRLAKAAGLDKEIVKQVGAVNGNISAQMTQFLSLHDYKPQFSADDFEKMAGGFAAVAEKDLTIALAQAEKLGEQLPGCQRSRELIGKVYRDNY